MSVEEKALREKLLAYFSSFFPTASALVLVDEYIIELETFLELP